MHGRFRVKQDEVNGPLKAYAKDNGAHVSDLAKLGNDERAAVIRHGAFQSRFQIGDSPEAGRESGREVARAIPEKQRARCLSCSVCFALLSDLARHLVGSCRARAWPNYVRSPDAARSRLCRNTWAAADFCCSLLFLHKEKPAQHGQGNEDNKGPHAQITADR